LFSLNGTLVFHLLAMNELKQFSMSYHMQLTLKKNPRAQASSTNTAETSGVHTPSNQSQFHLHAPKLFPIFPKINGLPEYTSQYLEVAVPLRRH